MSEALREFNRIKYAGTGSTENTGHSCLDGWVEIIFPDPPKGGATFVSASGGNVLTTPSQDFYNVNTGVLSAGTYYIEMVNEHVLYNKYSSTGYTKATWGWGQGEQLMGDMRRHSGTNPDDYPIYKSIRGADTDLTGLFSEECNPTTIPQLRKFDSATTLKFGDYGEEIMTLTSRIFILKTDQSLWRNAHVDSITEDYEKLAFDPLRKTLSPRTAHLTYRKDYTSCTTGVIADPYNLNQYRSTTRPSTTYGIISHPTLDQFDVNSSGKRDLFAVGQYKSAGRDNILSTAGMNGYYRHYASCAPVTELGTEVVGNIKTDPRAHYCMSRVLEVTGNVGRGENLNLPQTAPSMKPAGNTVHSNGSYIRLGATEAIAADTQGNVLNTFKSLDYRPRFRPDAKHYIYDISYYGSWDTRDYATRHRKNTFTTGTTLANSDLIPSQADNWSWFPEDVECMVVLVSIAVDFGLCDVEVRYGDGSKRDQTRIVNAAHPTAIFHLNWNNINKGVVRLRFLRRTGNSSGESFEYVNITRVVLNAVSDPYWG